MTEGSSSSQHLVKNRVSENEQIDRLSHLPESLLLVILSLLPTEVAARTSVLSRLFYQIWKCTNLTEYCALHVPDMDDCPLLHRNPSPYPLFHLTLYPHYDEMTADEVASLLRKAQSLGLRRLKVHLISRYFESVLPIIFSFDDLLSLSFKNSVFSDSFFLFLPSNISLTRLKTLSLCLFKCDSVMLNELVSRLYSLEELSIELQYMCACNISFETITKLELTIHSCQRMMFSMPNLEHLGLRILHGEMPRFLSEVPKLRKASISIHLVRPSNVPAICDILKKMMNVESLKLDLTKEDYYRMHPFHVILDPRSEPPVFANLKSLDLKMCFHEKNMEDLIRLLQNCPLLESLNLIHKGPETIHKRKRNWGNRSRFSRNADGNNQHAYYFPDLHIEENRNQLIERLTKKQTSKRVNI